MCFQGRPKATLSEHARNARLGRELLGHCVFVAVFCVVTIVPVDDPNIENFTYSMRSLFLQEDNLLFNSNSSFAGPRFVDVMSVSDYWKWLKGPMLHAAYMTDWYRGIDTCSPPHLPATHSPVSRIFPHDVRALAPHFSLPAPFLSQQSPSPPLKTDHLHPWRGSRPQASPGP